MREAIDARVKKTISLRAFEIAPSPSCPAFLNFEIHKQIIVLYAYGYDDNLCLTSQGLVIGYFGNFWHKKCALAKALDKCERSLFIKTVFDWSKKSTIPKVLVSMDIGHPQKDKK